MDGMMDDEPVCDEFYDMNWIGPFDTIQQQ